METETVRTERFSIYHMYAFHSFSRAALISLRSMLPSTIFSVLTVMVEALVSMESSITLLPEIVWPAN